MKFNHEMLDPEKWMRWLHLRPRPKTEEEKRYGTFNRRMMAATFDSLIATALIAPVVDLVFLKTYGPATITVQEIASHASQAANGGEATRMFMEELRSSGLFDRLTANFRWHLYVLSIYVTLCWYFWAATPGKMICRLKIVDAKTGGRLSDWQSILRVLGYFVSAIPFGLGFFWIGLNRKRQGFHDLLAGTVVVSQPWRKKKEDVVTSAP